MIPHKFITGNPPAPVPGLSGSANAVAALAGLIDWHTIDPAFSQAIGERITNVAPRVGTHNLINIPPNSGGGTNTGPLMAVNGGYPSAEFDLNFLTNLSTNEHPLTTTNMSAVLIVYSDGAGDQQRRVAGGFNYNTGNAIGIAHQLGIWTTAGISTTETMTGGAGFIMAIVDSYMASGVNTMNIRVRDRAVTRVATPTAYDAVARVGNANCRLSLGQERAVTNTTSNWDDGIMESMTFVGPTISNTARLAAIDAYFNAVYLNA